MNNSDRLFEQALRYEGVSEINRNWHKQSNKILDSVVYALGQERTRFGFSLCFGALFSYQNAWWNWLLLPDHKPIVAARKFLDIGVCMDTPKRGDLVILGTWII